MKTTMLLSLVVLMAAGHGLQAQTSVHPWNVIDAAGGTSTSAGKILHSSIGQPLIGMTDSGGVNLETGSMPGTRILTGASTHFFAFSEAGWNMISVPLLVQDYGTTALYPTAITSAFAFLPTGYVVRDTLEDGVGYWLKFGGEDSLDFLGTAVIEDTISVQAGWNIIGTLGYPVPVAAVVPLPPVVIIGSFFGFSVAGGYAEVDTLEPSRSYWVKVSQSGRLVLRAGSQSGRTLLASRKPEKGISSDIVDKIDLLTVTDARGAKRKLLFSAKPLDADLNVSELPPPPPSGILDVRYASQRSLEAPAKESGSAEFPIQITGAIYPVTFTWNDIRPDQKLELVLTHPDRRPEYRPLQGSGSTTISNERLLGLALRVRAHEPTELPAEFALHQNYPNPFNPATTIRYDLPVAVHVTLKVYTILGQEVATLTDEVQEAGYKAVEWGPSTSSGQVLASGVYFYRLQAGHFTSVRKMIITK